MWLGAVEGHAHEILSDAESIDEDGEGGGGTESARDFAKQFLDDILSEKDCASNEVKSEAKEADISWATIRRAAEDLGVKKYKSMTLGKWVWSLKNSSEKEAARLIYSTCSSDDEHIAQSPYGGQVEQVEQVHINKGSQLAQTHQKKHVAQVAQPFNSEQVVSNLGQNTSKSEVESSWGEYKNDPQVRVSI